jgi:prepilin-type processing-associated H-X9-DG protein
VQSIDVGCMQVNLMYHPRACRTLAQAFDPRANALYAGQFLNALYADGHDWSRAIALYHSDTPALGEAYRVLVLARWHSPGLRDTALPFTAYRDFDHDRPVYGAFIPVTRVYGAFAPASNTP